MKIENVGAALAVGAVVALLVTIGLVIFRLELDMLYTLALVLIIGLVVAVIVAAAALPIRALRKRDNPPERHLIKHTHTIDREGRVVDAPKIYTLPQQQQAGWSGMFPEFLRAAYLAGNRDNRLPGAQEADVTEADVTDLTEEWDDEIRG